jgi:hypothetical protein
MTIESAKSAVLALLRDKGRATNSALLAAIGQNRALLLEGDHLLTVVFPELRERVEQMGLEFFDVANCDANVAMGTDLKPGQNHHLAVCFA